MKHKPHITAIVTFEYHDYPEDYTGSVVETYKIGFSKPAAWDEVCFLLVRAALDFYTLTLTGFIDILALNQQIQRIAETISNHRFSMSDEAGIDQGRMN